ncbi:Sec-independent protein translocase subunit TatA [Nocardioides zeae]|uniref:Sec-independent protein translocase protein TatA n=1 Tax=Nocardioides zeae TaxID=1457234 RepID=A0A6P0HIQ9_9ACTN|nr:twin-arginine translocase TatA/TatE family subunit [Nocardioides zeae]
MVLPLVTFPGGWELVLIILVIVLLFGAKKLPELARGTGQALRIFKSETKGLVDDDDDEKDAKGRGTTAELPLEARQVDDAEALRQERRDTTNG